MLQLGVAVGHDVAVARSDRDGVGVGWMRARKPSHLTSCVPIAVGNERAFICPRAGTQSPAHAVEIAVRRDRPRSVS